MCGPIRIGRNLCCAESVIGLCFVTDETRKEAAFDRARTPQGYVVMLG